MVTEDISLKPYNTFGLDYKARSFISVRSEDEAGELFRRGNLHQRQLILGGGSNLLFVSDFEGSVIHPEIAGISIDEQEDGFKIISAGAGVKWDSLVEWAVENELGGIENLSLIPGSVGAAPVQNIGAYGAEAGNTILKVRAVSVKDGSVREFDNSECQFGYRSSLFKGQQRGQYLITRVFFRLSTIADFNLDYGSLREETYKLGGVTLKNIRSAVINIRRSKLPDPEIIGNAGSFFKNPLVPPELANELKKKYPRIPCYEDSNGAFKLAAGWLIEQCGWKGRRIGRAGVHEKQALVIVNLGGATGEEILFLSEEIRKSVYADFGISLEREVEVIGSI